MTTRSPSTRWWATRRARRATGCGAATPCSSTRPATTRCCAWSSCRRRAAKRLWASTYDMYDRLSRPVEAFLEGLTFTGGKPELPRQRGQERHPLLHGRARRARERRQGPPHRAPRRAHQPRDGVAWAVPLWPARRVINGVTKAESQPLLDWIHSMAVSQHDLQVRFR
jgi:hypothetical protein